MIPEILGSAVLDGGYKMISELLRCNVKYRPAPTGAYMTYGVEQVGLAKTHAGIEEQRIVSPSWGVGYRLSRAVSQLVTAPHNKGIKRVLSVKFLPREVKTRAADARYLLAGAY